MASQRRMLSPCRKLNHPDSESGLQWFAESLVTGPATGASCQYHHASHEVRESARRPGIHPGGMTDGSRGSKRRETPGSAAVWVGIL